MKIAKDAWTLSPIRPGVGGASKNREFPTPKKFFSLLFSLFSGKMRIRPFAAATLCPAERCAPRKYAPKGCLI
jgi:hypothetical protein